MKTKFAKRIFILLFIINCMTVSAQTSLRDYIVVIKPAFSEPMIRSLKLYNEVNNSTNTFNESLELKSITEGKYFGTGFFVKAAGKIYLLTNYQLVRQAGSVTAELYRADGSKILFEKCSFAGFDSETDLALISLPDSAAVTNAFEISTAEPNDGMNVTSAGFLDMKGVPSWQLSKGIISNSAFSMETLDEKIKLRAIQHTAQIDRGCAGSPLLIPDKSQPSGYSVAGINSWKVANRENVNLAIPAGTILKFLNKTLQQQLKSDTVSLHQKFKIFAGDAAQDCNKLVKYIAYNQISNFSVADFYSHYNRASMDVKLKTIGLWNNESPGDAIRYIIAWAIHDQIVNNRKLFSFYPESGITQKGDTVFAAFRLGEDTIQSTWIAEQNDLRLYNIALLNPFDSKKSMAAAYDFLYTFSAGPVYAIPSTNAETPGMGIETDILFSPYLFMGLSFHFNNHDSYLEKFDYDLYQNVRIPNGYAKYTQLCTHIGCQYPMKISRLYFIPFLKVSLGIYNGDVSAFFTKASAGLKTAVEIDKKSYLVLNLYASNRKLDEDYYFGSSPNKGLLNTGNIFETFIGLSYALRIEMPEHIKIRDFRQIF